MGASIFAGESEPGRAGVRASAAPCANRCVRAISPRRSSASDKVMAWRYDDSIRSRDGPGTRRLQLVGRRNDRPARADVPCRDSARLLGDGLLLRERVTVPLRRQVLAEPTHGGRMQRSVGRVQRLDGGRRRKQRRRLRERFVLLTMELQRRPGVPRDESKRSRHRRRRRGERPVLQRPPHVRPEVLEHPSRDAVVHGHALSRRALDPDRIGISLRCSRTLRSVC
jgi:hypothetical protein